MIKKIQKTDFLYVFVLFLFLMPSCRKENFDFKNKFASTNKYDPNMSLPLVHSKLSIEDIISGSSANQFFKTDASNIVTLFYKSNVFEKYAKDVFSTIDDQTFSNNYNFTLPFGLPVGDSAFTNYNPVFSLTTTNGEQFDSITVKSGTLRFHLNSSNYNHQAKFDVTLPNVLKNGTAFKTTIHYTYSGSLPVDITRDFDLTGYTIAFTPTNQLAVNIKITGYGDNNTNTSPYDFNFETSLIAVQYLRMFGYLGQRTISLGQDSILLHVFKNNFNGSMQVDDPKLKINVYNSFGIPVKTTFNKLQVYSSVNAPNTINIGGTGLNNPLTIGYPTMSQIGQSVLTSVLLNKGNSNIADAINISPKKFLYDIIANTNPLGVSSPNFVLDTSKIKVDFEIEIPLSDFCGKFIIQDTMPFGVTELSKDIKDLKWIKFRVNAENWFPLDAVMQIYFTDTIAGNKYHIVDSLILNSTDKIIDGAIQGPSPNYRVTTPKLKLTEILVEKDKLEKIENCNNMFIRATINTIYNPLFRVRIYNNYILDIKLSAQVQLDVSY
ncbi:MAG: hypothetical protein WC223_12390 [Bacteroidales bacterium]|jgi:hypothetical protein